MDGPEFPFQTFLHNATVKYEMYMLAAHSKKEFASVNKCG
jgi:hypothetical protein